jgi:hypothetical protein
MPERICGKKEVSIVLNKVFGGDKDMGHFNHHALSIYCILFITRNLPPSQIFDTPVTGRTVSATVPEVPSTISITRIGNFIRPKDIRDLLAMT